MKVICYIGHHKVGSTSLQVFLSQNSYKLLKAGILYPSVEVLGLVNSLAKATRGKEVARVLPANIREPHSALAYTMMSIADGRPVPKQYRRLPSQPQMIHAIQTQVQQLQPNTVILCSEAFANFGAVDPNLITKLCEIFPNAEFEIYCALRRPDTYLVSWHGQRLKVAEHLEPLREKGVYQYLNTIHFNYRLAVEAWKLRCPEGNLILRNYDDVIACGGSIQDFTTQVDVPFPDALEPAKRMNQSLPWATIEVVRRANIELDENDRIAVFQFMMNLPDTIRLVPNRDIEMLSKKIRQKLFAQFKPIHAYLNEASGSGAFFPDLDDMLNTRPVAELDAVKQMLSQLTPDILSKVKTDGAREFLSTLRHEYRVN